MYLPLFVGVLYVLSSFAIIFTRKTELVALLLLSFGCPVNYCNCKCPVALPHGAMGWSAVCDCGPDHTHLLKDISIFSSGGPLVQASRTF